MYGKTLLLILGASLLCSPLRAEDPSEAFDGLPRRDDGSSLLVETGCQDWVSRLGSLLGTIPRPGSDPRDEGYELLQLGEWIAGAPGGPKDFSPRHDGPGRARGLRLPHATGDEEARLASSWYEKVVADRLWYAGLSSWKKAVVGTVFAPDERPLPLGFAREDFAGSTAPVLPERLGHLASGGIWEERVGRALQELGTARPHPCSPSELLAACRDRIEDPDRRLALLELRPADGAGPSHVVLAHALARCRVRPRCGEHRKGELELPATAILCLDLDPQLGRDVEGEASCLLLLDDGLLCLNEAWREALEKHRSLSFQRGHRLSDEALALY